MEVTMKTTIWAVALTLVLAISAWAQPSPEVLILPVEMPGYYNPVDSEGLTKTLEAGLRKMAPNAHLQVSRAADLTAYGYQAGSDQPPSAEMADKLCRAYGASHVTWVSIRFQPDYQAETGALALAGAARFWGYSADQRRVMFDQPLSLVRVGQVKRAHDEAAAKAAALELANGCINDLAYQIVGIARQRTQKPPASATDWSSPEPDPTHSAGYKAMIRATQSYQKAMKNSSLVDITTSTADMTRAWAGLNPTERRAIEDNYPGIKDAMTQAPVYNYGGYGWGWR
jgi:hypothetical protein